MDVNEKETICKQIGDMKDQTKFMKKFRLALGSALNEIQNLRTEIAVLKQENSNFKKGGIDTNTSPMQQNCNNLSECNKKYYEEEKEIESNPNFNTTNIEHTEAIKPETVFKNNAISLQKSEQTLNKLANHIKRRNESVKVMSQRLTVSNNALYKREKKLEEKLHLIEEYKKYTAKLENDLSRSAYLNEDTVRKLHNEQQRGLENHAEIRYLKNQVQYLKREADKMYYKLKDREQYPSTCSKCKVVLQNANDAASYTNHKDHHANYGKGNKYYGRSSPMKGFRNIPKLSPISEEQVLGTQQFDQEHKTPTKKTLAGRTENTDSKSESPKEGSFTYFNVGKPNSPKTVLDRKAFSPDQQTKNSQSRFETSNVAIHNSSMTRQMQNTVYQNSPVKYNPVKNDAFTAPTAEPLLRQVQSIATSKVPDNLVDSPQKSNHQIVKSNDENPPMHSTPKVKTPVQALSSVPRNMSLQNDGTSSDTSISSCSSSKSGRKSSKKRKKSAKYITFYGHRIDVTKFTKNDFKDVMWGISAAGVAPRDFLRFLAEHTARLNSDVTWAGRHTLGEPADWLSLEDCY